MYQQPETHVHHSQLPRVRRVVLIGVAIAGLLVPASAPLRAQPTDTIRVSTSPLFTRNDAYAALAFAVATVAITPADRWMTAQLQDSLRQANPWFQRTATAVRETAYPGALIIGTGLYLYGRGTDNDKVADLGLHGLEAVVVGSALNYVLKGTIGRARPYVDNDNPRDFGLARGFLNEDYRSFPSGHTLAAFAAAAAVTSETSRWWPDSKWYIGTAMYGGALLAGTSRIYNNKHWASDVMMGAAIGTFAGLKVVRYHHTHPDNRIDKLLLGISATTDERGERRLSLILAPTR
jgi:membrane-associated phospholipid phosphatase